MLTTFSFRHPSSRCSKSSKRVYNDPSSSSSPSQSSSPWHYTWHTSSTSRSSPSSLALALRASTNRTLPSRSGLVYLVISSFPTLWTSPQYYDFSTQISGLHFIAIAIGYGLGSQITARFNDWTYRRLKKKNGGKGVPEVRTHSHLSSALRKRAVLE